MSYLVDTNVLSELKRRQVNESVAQWFADRPANSLYISVLTLGEIRKGINHRIEPARRQTLIDWLEFDLPRFFLDRVLPIDTAVANRWGKLAADTARPLPAIDSLVVATALTHGLALVTRNVRDFEGLGVEVINPFAISK